LALIGAFAGLDAGCSFLEGGNSPRTAVRILEGGAISDRHYARVSPAKIEEAARAALASRGFTVDEAEYGGRGSTTSRTLDASCRTGGRVLVLIDEVDMGDVQVTVQVIPADDHLARVLQDEIARRLSAPGSSTSGSGPATAK
jgi:hypothetical protein